MGRDIARELLPLVAFGRDPKHRLPALLPLAIPQGPARTMRHDHPLPLHPRGRHRELNPGKEAAPECRVALHPAAFQLRLLPRQINLFQDNFLEQERCGRVHQAELGPFAQHPFAGRPLQPEPDLELSVGANRLGRIRHFERLPARETALDPRGQSPARSAPLEHKARASQRNRHLLPATYEANRLVPDTRHAGRLDRQRRNRHRQQAHQTNSKSSAIGFHA